MDPLTHCVTVAQFLPLATLPIFICKWEVWTECVLSLFCMSLGTSVTMEGSPSFQIRVSEVQIEWRLVQGHRARQRQNQDWDRRPLTPTRTLELSPPKPICVQAAMPSHGDSSGVSPYLLSLLLQNGCCSLSLEFQGSSSPDPHPGVSPAPPQHLPPPAGDRVTNTPCKEHPWGGAEPVKAPVTTE